MLNFTGFRLELLTEGVLADEDWTIGRVDIARICGRGKGLELRPELGRCLIREDVYKRQDLKVSCQVQIKKAPRSA